MIGHASKASGAHLNRIIETADTVQLSYQDIIIPEIWQWFLWPAMAVALAYALYRFPYRSVTSEPRLVHLVLGSSMFFLGLWNLGAGLDSQGFEIHLFGVTAVVILIGVSPALLAVALALLLDTVVDAEPQWSNFAANFVLGSLLPVLFSAAALGLVRLLPQNNLFAFTLGGGFFGAIAARLLSTLTIFVLFATFGTAASFTTIQSHLPWMLLVAFPEGFVNGMLVSTVTIYYPAWVRSFDEQRYLGKKIWGRRD